MIGGDSCAGHPQLLEQARATVERHADAAGLPAPLLRAARYGALAPAVGAAAFVLHEYLRPLHRDAGARQAQKSRRPAKSPAA
ncbi:hypothetical protein D3C84_1165770 [compost metagenome]